MSAPDENATTSTAPARVERTPMKALLALVLGLLALIYLINPTAGVLELIPDNIPFVGNLDEVTATTILLGTLSYFGIDLPWLRRK